MVWDAGIAVLSVVLGARTLWHVWRGGTTWNDHAVAAVVAGCVGIYPLLWVGARQSGVAGPVLGLALMAGMVGIWGLFFVLDSRRERDDLRWLVVVSQVAYGFSLWAGLVGLLWWAAGAVAVALGASWTWLWPGPLLLLPLALSLGAVAWTWLRRDHVRVERLPAWHGHRSLRVVHLSDLHASPTTTGRDLRRTVDTALALAPDLVVVTGDLVMPFSEANHGWLIEALSRLTLAGVPVLGCPGNHDLAVSEQLGHELEAVGVRWLVDAADVVEIRRPSGAVRVEVVGLDFRWSGSAAHIDAVLSDFGAGVDADVRLLLAHDPRYFSAVPPGRFDLVLSGHTHGGQVGWDFLGWPGSVLGLLGVYDQGLFIEDGKRLTVSRGNWHLGLPPRLGIASEVTAIDLMAPAEASSRS